jgi:hypothetical protein
VLVLSVATLKTSVARSRNCRAAAQLIAHSAHPLSSTRRTLHCKSPVETFGVSKPLLAWLFVRHRHLYVLVQERIVYTAVRYFLGTFRTVRPPVTPIPLNLRAPLCCARAVMAHTCHVACGPVGRGRIVTTRSQGISFTFASRSLACILHLLCLHLFSSLPLTNAPPPSRPTISLSSAEQGYSATGRSEEQVV